MAERLIERLVGEVAISGVSLIRARITDILTENAILGRPVTVTQVTVGNQFLTGRSVSRFPRVLHGKIT